MRARPGGNTLVGLVALVLLFILLIALIVVFSQRILAGLASFNAQANTVATIVAVLFPLTLLGVIVTQMVRLIRERAGRQPGSRLKTRLLLFFVLVAALSSIPQALLSVTFINSTMNFWLQARIGEALRGGLSISLEYYRGLVDNLASFNASPLLSSVLRDLEANPERLWRNVRTINDRVSFIQVFAEDGAEVLFRGDPQGRIANFRLLEGRSGDLPKEDRLRLSILRNVTLHRVDGRDYRVVVGTILSEGFDERARSLTESLESFNQLNRYRRLFRTVLTAFYFFFSFPIFLISILISFLLAAEIIRPIVSLEDATRRVAEGDYSFRILSRSRDELSVLVDSFNRMVGELANSRRKLVHAEKITAWKEIAQQLAHEIKNPLTPIKLSAQRILKRYRAGPADLGQVLEPAVSAIVREVDNLNRLLEEFREFARLPGPRPVRLSVRELVEEVCTVYRSLSAKVFFSVEQVDPELTITADRSQLKQVFANLFKNAGEALPGGGTVQVRAERVSKGGRAYCRIWVKDDGVGMNEEERRMLFRPYFTTKKDGTGLGLAIVERIIFDHDGTIAVETQAGAGTTFIIDLPLEQ